MAQIKSKKQKQIVNVHEETQDQQAEIEVVEQKQSIEQFYISPIATPMTSDKLRNRILKLVKRSILIKHLKRGVKEVSKAIRKKTKGICIFAADVNPVDVISHLPINCEENGIPYCFVRSRMELGAAAQTKKPTSVALILKPDDQDVKGVEKYNQILEKVRAINQFV